MKINNQKEYDEAIALFKFLCLKPEYGGTKADTRHKRAEVLQAMRDYETMSIKKKCSKS